MGLRAWWRWMRTFGAALDQGMDKLDEIRARDLAAARAKPPEKFWWDEHPRATSWLLIMYAASIPGVILFGPPGDIIGSLVKLHVVVLLVVFVLANVGGSRR